MRPASLALLLLALAGLAVGTVAWRNATEETRAWDRLQSLHGQDLPALSKDPARAQEIRALFSRFGGDFSLPIDLPFRVFRFGDSSHERTLLLRFSSHELGLSLFQPLQADVLGPDRRKLTERTFAAVGTSSTTAVPYRRPGDPTDYVRLHVYGHLSPARPESLYFAIDRDHLVLVRAEGPDGRHERLGYPPFVPPALFLRPPPAWEADLRSALTPRILAALVYLEGIHPLPGDPLKPGIPREDGESRALAEAHAHPGVRACILELRKSADPWIREAAEAVPLDGTR